MSEAVERSSKWRWVWIPGAIIGLLAGIYFGAQWYFADKVPLGATMAGVDIGGLSATDAVMKVDTELGERTTNALNIVVEDDQLTFDPVAAGMSFDAQASIDQVVGFSIEPMKLWNQLFEKPKLEIATSIDDDKFSDQFGQLVEAVAQDPVEPVLTFAEGKVHATDGEVGRALAADEATEILRQHWLDDVDFLELPTETVEPQISQEALQNAKREIADPVVSGPVVVTVAEERAELSTAALTQIFSIVPSGNTFELQADAEALSEFTEDLRRSVQVAARNASFVFEGGKPVIKNGTVGKKIDQEELLATVQAAATSAQRMVSLELVETEPKISAADLEELGVKEVVGSFSTPLNNDYNRNVNIIRGAELVTGVLTRPGEIFSLNSILEPYTFANGYVEATVIVNGRYQGGLGGGLSQMATTVYNAGFFAGMEDVEHRPHSYYISRYPEGREATIVSGSLDMRFKNNTPYGVLAQSWVSGGQLHVQLWSTKYWEVQHSSSGRYNVVSPRTITEKGPNCIPQDGGAAGFSITIYRDLLRNGKVEHEDSWSWTYNPQNQIICEK